MNRWRTLLVPGLALIAAATAARAGELLIHADTSDPAPRAAFEQVVADFEKENPDVDVTLTVYDHEGFKQAIRLFLMFDAPDVVTWYAGERMRFFAERGLFEDVSDVWREQGLDQSMAPTRGLLSVDGKQYGVPYTYYQWGVYYRKDLFERHGLEPPRTWEEFLAVCGVLKGRGVTPIAIGTEALWPAAGWFDYLNLRTNGLDFHLDLTAGRVSYNDERVRRVFSTWQPLVEAGYFSPGHVGRSWQEAAGMVARGEAAMILIGNFVAPLFKDAGVTDRIGFFAFPTIDAAVARYEEAPVDTVHIPSAARNKADARRFLAFIARPEVQARMNATLGQLPANVQAEVPEAPFLDVGSQVLEQAAGLTQFYDRDTTPEMARAGMLGFRKFLEEPRRLDFILQRLELERRRIHEIRQPLAAQ